MVTSCSKTRASDLCDLKLFPVPWRPHKQAEYDTGCLFWWLHWHWRLLMCAISRRNALHGESPSRNNVFTSSNVVVDLFPAYAAVRRSFPLMWVVIRTGFPPRIDGLTVIFPSYEARELLFEAGFMVLWYHVISSLCCAVTVSQFGSISIHTRHSRRMLAIDIESQFPVGFGRYRATSRHTVRM